MRGGARAVGSSVIEVRELRPLTNVRMATALKKTRYCALREACR